MSDTPQFAIDKNVAMPSKRGRATSPLSIALRQMEVGDSILLSYRERNSAFAIAHGLSIKLASRRVEPNQVRVWKIA